MPDHRLHRYVVLHIKLKYQTDEVDLFSDDDMDGDIQPIPREDYENRSTTSVWYGSILENMYDT